MRIGPYETLAELGRGGMGTVYRGRDLRDGREVALKLLLALDGPEDLLRFGREVQVLLTLRHPHVVGVLDAGRERGRPYLVMRLVRGESLAGKLRREGPLAPPEAARLVARLARAVAYAHEQGVLHRDLKPENVLLDAGGEPVLTDFGLAALEGARERLTATGTALGTPAFMAPEQALGHRARQGPATDVYGLGATLFALLTGRPPFTGAGALAVLADVVQTPPPRPSRLRPGIAPDLEGICLRCLAKEPGERFGSAAALAEALEGWLTRARRRRPRALAAAAIALAGAASAGAIVVTRDDPGEPAAASPSPSSSASPSPGARPEAGDRDLAAAEQAFAAEDYERAAADATRALEGAPSARAYVLRARARGRSGDIEGAETDAAAALELAPGHAKALELLGWAAHRRGELELAEAHLQEAVAAAPGDPNPSVTLATVLLQRGAEEEALRVCDRALASSPGDARILETRARAHLALGAPAAAEADCDRALDQEETFRVLHLRALAKAARWRYREALEDLDRAAALASGGDLARIERARAAIRQGQGDLPGALEHLERAVELAPEVEELRQARDQLRAHRAAFLAQAPPAEGGAHGALTSARLARRAAERATAGDARAALADLTRALELDPHDAYLLASRSELARQMGHLEEARRYLDAARAAGFSERVLPYLEVELLVLEGKLDAALAASDLLVAERPAAPEVQALRAYVLWRRGELEAAEALADAVLARAPAAQAFLVRGDRRRRGGDREGAIQDLVMVCRQVPPQSTPAREAERLLELLGVRIASTPAPR